MRKNHIQLFLILALSCLTKAAYGQNILTTPLRWVSAETVNLKNNERFGHACSFVSNTTTIRWEQKNSTKVKNFSIKSFSGIWQDVKNNGKIEYTVEDGAANGVIIFERRGVDLNVTIDFSQTIPHGMHNQFIIRQIITEN